MKCQNKNLRNLPLLDHYRSDQEDIIGKFLNPALAASIAYSRAVGYFTSNSMSLYSRGLETFAANGGRMRLIASPNLTEADIEDIKKGYDARVVAENAAIRELSGDLSEETNSNLGILGKLISENKLDIKLAFIQSDHGPGIYHEKIGFFRDSFDNIVAFTGSGNETQGGLLANFESFEVYKGWSPGDDRRALRLEEDFEELWRDDTQSLSVIPFPEVAKDLLIGIARSQGRINGNVDTSWRGDVSQSTGGSNHLALPKNFIVRTYQRDAVTKWLENQGMGILKMATGTGKTKTALIAATQLFNTIYRNGQSLIVIVVAPYTHLVDQWVDDIVEFGVSPIAIYESSDSWQHVVEEQIMASKANQRKIVVLVATNASFAGDRFQNILHRISQPFLLIGDEVHNLGSAHYRNVLPGNATYRLALSATPERWHDDEGTESLVDYFGDVVYELGLEKAIGMGALTKYEYWPRLVELTELEAEHYSQITSQIARLLSNDKIAADDGSRLGSLLRKRANILGHASGKVQALKNDLTKHVDQHFQLVYCAEGRRPSPPGEEDGPSQMDETLELLGQELGITTQKYVSDTPRELRKSHMKRFGEGKSLQALVAMRCLDEGVDIPDARIGYLLASSSNPKQFVQRRGRLLRRAPGKERAVIYDYLAVPPASISINFEVERKLLIREIIRANEFGELSENYGRTLEALRPLKERYQLMDI